MRAAMDEETTIRIKQEEVDDMPNDPVSMFPDDTFGISCLNDFIKEDPELNLEADETENIMTHWMKISAAELSNATRTPISNIMMPNTSVVDHMEAGWIKNDDETNEVCSMEVDSKIYPPQSSRFTNVAREANSIPFQETCLLGVTEDKLDIATDTSAHIVGCENPGQVLFSQEENALHNRNNSDVKENKIHEFTCSSCKQTFLSKYNLIIHVFIHIDSVRPPAHICMMCGEVFLTHDSLSNHSLVQAERSGEECQHNAISNKCGNRQCCEVMCADKTQPKCESDNKLSTASYRLRPRRSDIRGDSFSNSGCIKRQTVRHAAEGLLECEICGKSFTQPYYFKRHSVTHTGKRPHKCNVCGKSYTVSDSLKRHLLTHSGERSHKCHICGKAFIASDTLKKHELIHTGERPHKCDVCGKSFTERSSLKKHNVTHTGERPHKCHICGKSFTQSGSLKKHVVKHIGESIQL